ncbi:phage tail tape measure protein [Desulfobacter hydrogenophilus]|uniref:phage tail tape measure protein n=1 Tax=Desulfobacter hydrogenophilus TaxID=2291 RepID=UPI001A9494A4|nr:phage tail tape measure protein [Desulfobacter hydrogenophilus]
MDTVFSVQAVMSLIDNITAPLRAVRNSMGDTERAAGGMAARMGVVTKAMLPLAVAAGIFLGGITGAAAATVETQSALGELASVGITDLNRLSKAGEQFSWQWAGTTKAEFISAAYDIKSGISTLTDAGVAEFTKLAALTGKATKSTTAEMTSLFATGYGIYKEMYSDLSDIDFGKVFSAGISSSVKNFKTTGSGMAQAISQLGATATTAGVSIAEQFTMLGMLQATMTGSEAGTKYKAIMQSAAGAGEKLGLQFMDSNRQLLSMPKILTALKGKYGATLDAMEKMDIQKAFGTHEAMAVIDLLYGKIEGLEGNITGMGEAMKNGSNVTSSMADTMNRDLGALYQLNRQRFHNLKEIIGNIFTPVMLFLSTCLGNVLSLLSFIAATKVGKAFISIAAVVSVAIVAFTAFTAVCALSGIVIPFITTALAGLAMAIAAVSWPVWAVAAAVAALYLSWKKNFGGIADIVTGWWNKISLVFRGVRAVFASLNGTHGMIEGELAKEIKAAGLVGLITTVSRVVFRIQSFFSGLWDAIKFSVAGVADILRPVFESFMGAVSPLLDIFKAVGSAIGQVVSALFGFTASTDVSGWRTFGEVIGIVVGAAFQLLAWAVRIALVPLQLVFDVVGVLLKAFVMLGEGIGTACGWIVEKFTSLWATAKEKVGGIGGIFDAMVAAVKWAFMNLTPVGWLIQAFTGVSEFFDSVDFSESGAKMMHTLADGIKSALMVPVDLVKSGLSKIRDLLPFSDAKEGPLSALTASGRAMMDTLGAGVRGAAPGLAASVKGAVAGVTAAMVIAAPGMADIKSPVVNQIKPPVMADIQTPALADVQAPTMPELEALTLPGIAAPTVDEIKPPVMTDIQTPALADVQAPTMPELEALTLPGIAAPTVDEIKPPVMTDIQTPALADVQAPVMPELEALTLPGIAAPTVDEIKPPAMADIQTPALADVQAPVMPELEALTLPDMPEPGNLPGPDTGTTSDTAGKQQEGSRASSEQSGEGKTIIQNLTVNLSGVQNAESFMAQLKQMVEAHDV